MTSRQATQRRPTATFAAISGLLLAAVGVAGFFYSSDFAAPGHTAAVFGVLDTNGWTNLLHILTAAAALVVAAAATRSYAAPTAFAYIALAAWGLAVSDHDALAGFVARGPGTDILHGVIGLAALAALLLERRPPPT